MRYQALRIPAQHQRPGRLRIVANSIPILDDIGGWAPHNLLMLGEFVLSEYQATVGPETLRMLQQISATIEFLGCDGLAIEGGIAN